VISRARATWPSRVSRATCTSRRVARSAVKRFRAGLVNVVAIDLSIAVRDRRAPIVSLFERKRSLIKEEDPRGLKMQLDRRGELHYTCIGNLSRKIIALFLLFSLIFIMLLCEQSSSVHYAISTQY